MIRIKNVYYMLSYAFRILNEEKYHDIKAEEFQYTADLMAAILLKGLSSQIKRGLGRDYIEKTDMISTPRGKIDVSLSIKEQAIFSRKLVCIYDSFEENTYMNQVLKSTAQRLIQSDDVKMERKKALKKLMLYFNNVDIIDLVADHPEERAARRRLASKSELRAILTDPLDGLDDTGLAGFLSRQRAARADMQGGLF